MLVAAACVGTPAVISAPPAMLTAALASRHPNGLRVGTLTVTLGASGTVLTVRTDAEGAMHQVVENWSKRVTFASPSPKCGASPVELGSVDFFPPSSGVVG